MQETVLSIEAGVAGGSLALLRDGQVFSGWANRDQVSRSERLLDEISALIKGADLEKTSLTRIAVSIGPGSYTGIRIGIATAMGLSRSLGITCAGISVMKAIAMSQPAGGETVVAVPIGRNGLCWQSFDRGTDDPNGGAIENGDISAFESALSDGVPRTVMVHNDLFEPLRSRSSEMRSRITLINVGRELAAFVGTASESYDEGFEPIYARQMSFPTLTGDKVVR